MKIKWLMGDVTAVGSIDITERAILGVILTGHFFCQLRPVGSPSGALISLLRGI